MYFLEHLFICRWLFRNSQACGWALSIQWNHLICTSSALRDMFSENIPFRRINYLEYCIITSEPSFAFKNRSHSGHSLEFRCLASNAIRSIYKPNIFLTPENYPEKIMYVHMYVELLRLSQNSLQMNIFGAKNSLHFLLLSTIEQRFCFFFNSRNPSREWTHKG